MCEVNEGPQRDVIGRCWYGHRDAVHRVRRISDSDKLPVKVPMVLTAFGTVDTFPGIIANDLQGVFAGGIPVHKAWGHVGD